MEQGSGDYITWSHRVTASQGQSVARLYNSGYFINDCLAVTHNAVSLSVSQVTLSSGCPRPQEVMASVQCAVWGQWPMFCSRCIYCPLTHDNMSPTPHLLLQTADTRQHFLIIVITAHGVIRTFLPPTHQLQPRAAEERGSSWEGSQTPQS